MRKKTFWLQILGLIFFGYLSTLSWLYFKERILHTDTSFYVFKMIQYGNFMVENNRYSDFFSQIFPLIALKSGCSIETFVKLYSVSFILFYYAIFLVITLFYKSFKGGMALMLSLCLGFRHTFYIPAAELQGSLAICVLLWAHLNRENGKEFNKFFDWLLLITYTLLCFFFHPLGNLLLIFILLSQILQANNKDNKKIWLLICLAASMFVFKLLSMTPSGYEASRIPQINDFVFGTDKLLSLPSSVYLKTFIFSQMKILLIAIVVVIFVNLFYKKWLSSILLVISIVGFLFIIVIETSKGESPQSYENYLVALGLFTSISFVNIVNKNKEWLCFLISVPLIFFSSRAILNSKTVFSKKIDYIDRMVNYGKKFPNRKYIVDNDNMPWNITWVSWTLPFETFLYSSIKYPDAPVTFFATDDINKYDSLLNDKSIFLGPEWDVYMFNYGANKLNNRYFRLPSLGYQKLNSSQSDSSFQESVFNKENVFLNPLRTNIRCDVDSFVVVPVKITNSSGKTICSLRDKKHPLSLSYHIYDQNGDEIIWDGYRTALDVDITDEFIQGVIINIPKQKGEYRIDLDFVIDGLRWMGINKNVKLIVS